MIGSDIGNREGKRDCVLPLGESEELKKNKHGNNTQDCC